MIKERLDDGVVKQELLRLVLMGMWLMGLMLVVCLEFVLLKMDLWRSAFGSSFYERDIQDKIVSAYLGVLTYQFLFAKLSLRRLGL